MKKIGTMTFHIAHNYGAMLQAYALPTAIQLLGYDCEIIDYRFPYIYQWSKVDSYKDLNKKYGNIGGILRYIKMLLQGYYNPKNKKNLFNNFLENVLPHSKRMYLQKEELNGLEYDFIIFGSDQIWNSQLTNGIATEFVGDFLCGKDTKKISYAASNGKSFFSIEEKTNYYPLLKNFSYLGIREKGLAKSLVLDGYDAKTVLDPTFLLTDDKWNEMVTKTKSYIKIPKKKYLLVYAFDEDDKIYSYIDILAKSNNLEVVILAYEEKDIINNYKVLTDCGPGDFVKLISNAEIVVTTSFHGTVFSIIYKKDFYTIPHPKYHERTDSLLELLDLNTRNLYDLNKICNVKPINWKNVDKILKCERKKSYLFLKESIGM